MKRFLEAFLGARFSRALWAMLGSLLLAGCLGDPVPFPDAGEVKHVDGQICMVVEPGEKVMHYWLLKTPGYHGEKWHRNVNLSWPDTCFSTQDMEPTVPYTLFYVVGRGNNQSKRRVDVVIDHQQVVTVDEQ